MVDSISREQLDKTRAEVRSGSRKDVAKREIKKENNKWKRKRRREEVGEGKERGNYKFDNVENC